MIKRQHPDGLGDDTGDVVVAGEGGQVAGDVEQVVVATAALLEAAQTHGKRALVQDGVRAVRSAAGDQVGGPRMHGDVGAGCQEGEVGQPGGVGPQSG